MLEEIIMAGFGGQGVMLMGQLIAYAAMLEGKYSVWIPSYGPEMRGGTANCSVTVSDQPIACPVISEPSTVIAMNRPSLDKFEPMVKKDGLLLINSSLVDKRASRKDIRVYEVPGSKIAEELGNPKIANIVILGALLKLTGIVSPEKVMDSLRKVLGPSKERLIPLNRSALEAGASYVSELSKVSGL